MYNTHCYRHFSGHAVMKRIALVDSMIDSCKSWNKMRFALISSAGAMKLMWYTLLSSVDNNKEIKMCYACHYSELLLSSVDSIGIRMW